MHFILKGLRLNTSEFFSSPVLPLSCLEIPAGLQEIPDSLHQKKAFILYFAIENHVLLVTLTFPHISTVKCASEMMSETAFCFQVNITYILHTQIFITRLPSIFYDCAIVKITSRSFFAFSDVRFLKISDFFLRENSERWKKLHFLKIRS